MSAPEELATIVINGKEYTNWETVSVQTDYHAAARFAVFTVSEQVGTNLTFAALQIKIGDECEVQLAGFKVITGKVFARQAAFDAGSHAVSISVVSNAVEIVHGTTPLKSSQYRGYGFQAIAQGLLEPFGISLSVVNPTSYASKPFKDINLWPGETVFETLDRLAKQRGMYIRDDANGGLVVGGGSTTSAGDFVEGQNIKSASLTVRDDTIKSTLGVVGQQRGDDQTDGEQARKPAAYGDGGYQGYRPHLVVSEEPGDADDMAHRADHENNWLLGRTVECNIVVQGWLGSNGQIYDIESCFTVTSPSLLLDGASLGAQTIIFSQDNSGGTSTTLTLVRPEARTGEIGKVQAPAGDGSSLPGGTPTAAQPETTGT
jgi:prophage tail gpP-like protein